MIFNQNRILFKFVKFGNFVVILILFSFLIVTFLQFGKISENEKKEKFENFPEVFKFFYLDDFEVFYKYIKDNIILMAIFYILEIFLYVIRAFVLVKKEFGFFSEFKKVEKIRWNRFKSSTECIISENYYIHKRKSIFVR